MVYAADFPNQRVTQYWTGRPALGHQVGYRQNLGEAIRQLRPMLSVCSRRELLLQCATW